MNISPIRLKLFGLYLLIALLFTAGIIGCSKERFTVKQPNVLVLLLDTLRADHLSGYGYERPTSPVLDQFAKENLKFNYAISAAPWTPASVASILTGMYPPSHGMMPPNNREQARQASARLNSNLETIPELLKKHGYRTAAVSPNPWISEEFGFTQGFETFKYLQRERAEIINKAGREIIEGWSGSKEPWFLYLHYLDPHDPYSPPDEYKELFKGPLANRDFKYPEKQLRNIGLYDGEIKYLDTELGKLFEWLKEKKLYDDLVIIVVADHGEQFLEHGDTRHGYKLYNEEIHVPLIIRTGQRGDSGRVVDNTVSTIDIYPTILDRLGIPVPVTYQGVSLLNDKNFEGRRGVYSQIRRIYDMRSLTNISGKKLILEIPFDEKMELTAITESWKSPKVRGVYDSRKDQLEKSRLSDAGLEASLKTSFDAVYQAAAKNQVEVDTNHTTTVTEGTLDQLKSLGYLQ